ncbi:hypothetical protein M5085_10545, partial [Neisseria meningitidis]|nr:hypothetical protein [Neisseria meningitidis]MCL6115202.1 hypothetical protein [Neisseria meningitidis]
MTHVISLWMVKTAFCHAKAEGKVQRAGIILGFADGIKDLVRKICIPPKISVSDGGGFAFEVQLSLTEKGQYAVAYDLSCKKDCHELHATDPRR